MTLLMAFTYKYFPGPTVTINGELFEVVTHELQTGEITLRPVNQKSELATLCDSVKARSMSMTCHDAMELGISEGANALLEHLINNREKFPYDSTKTLIRVAKKFCGE